MKNNLNWEAYSNEDRNKIIDLVKEVILKNDGYIMNYMMFSDLAISLRIEIEENKIIGMHNGLSSIFKLSELDKKVVNNNSQKEWIVSINISFIKGEGKLKWEVPAVPG